MEFPVDCVSQRVNGKSVIFKVARQIFCAPQEKLRIVDVENQEISAAGDLNGL
jgi:hypothetical protein